MKAVIIISRLLSAVFRPVYYPTVGIILLFILMFFLTYQDIARLIG